MRDAVSGLARALRARFWTFATATLTVGVLSVLLPPLLLSVLRKPVDFFTVNPWLRRLPEYLVSPEHPAWTKVEKLSNLALFWFSADSPYGGTEWGFAVDVRDLARIAVTSLLVGAYVALGTERHAMIRACAVAATPAGAPGPGAGRAGGVLGALAGVFGLTTGPCSVVGCGAPVLPVVGLVFTGLSSGTLKLLAGMSSIATIAILVVMVAATASLAWSVGARRRRADAATTLVRALVIVVVLGGMAPDRVAAADRAGAPPRILNACAGDLTEIAYWRERLKSRDREVRLAAVRALAAARTERALAALAEALRDDDETVRAEAARAIDRLPLSVNRP